MRPNSFRERYIQLQRHKYQPLEYILDSDAFQTLDTRDNTLNELLHLDITLEDKLPTTREETAKIDSLDDILEDKVLFLKELIEDINSQILERKVLRNKLLWQLDQSMCYLKTNLFEIESWPIGQNRSIEARRFGIEKLVEDLEKEKREELVGAWRDVSLLRKELRDTLKEYKNALRRFRLVATEKTSTHSRTSEDLSELLALR